ncbi:hypothetical protein DFH09DRAFT_879934, partial [Mycena vulgaris]
GLAWAECVGKFFDFEAGHDFAKGAQMTTTNRPGVVKDWLGRARQWDKKVAVRKTGTQGEADMFAAEWWTYWLSIQPADRAYFAGMLACPTRAEWGVLTKFHGRNGLLQVMATLLWWGEAVGDSAEALGYADRSAAVKDVAWVLKQL